MWEKWDAFFKVKWKPFTPDNVISTYWMFGFILSTQASRLNEVGAKTCWTGQSNSERVVGRPSTFQFYDLQSVGWEAHSPRRFTKCPACLSGRAEHGGHFLTLRIGGVGWCVCVCVCRALWQGVGGLLQAGGPFVVSHPEWPNLKDPFFIFIASRV